MLVHVPLLLLVLHFVVEALQDFVEALKANRMVQLDLQILVICEVLYPQRQHDLVRRV